MYDRDLTEALIKHRYEKLLRFLISKGADVNDRDPTGQTEISMVETTPSLKRGSRKIIKILEQAAAVR
jgi:ankyrin repeat protein